ncbi:MAG: hypothetical protein HQ542_11335 [Bacteroidia bacterium]|nr:hypothetical protein [Bacteroidia bacterium]
MKRPLFLALLCLSLILPLSFSSCFPESAVRQKKIDRNRKKQETKARKAYEMDLKRHHNSQSKETRSRMKDSRRKSKRVTPLKK